MKREVYIVDREINIIRQTGVLVGSQIVELFKIEVYEDVLIDRNLNFHEDIKDPSIDFIFRTRFTLPEAIKLAEKYAKLGR